MTLAVKQIKWILAGVSYVAVAALAAWAAVYLTKQWDPGYSTPVRANFSRRLAADAVVGERTYSFHYATNRPSTDLLDPASTRRAGSLSVGSFRARISPALVAAPQVWEDPDLLQVLPPENASHDSFFRELKSAVAQSEHRSLLIMVWGWKESWLSAAAKTAYISYLLDIDTPVVVFDWPANQGTNARGYVAARDMAHLSGADLGQFLETVIEQVQPENLWLVATSLGTQVVCDGFEYMTSRASLSDSEREIAHVVLTAPDVAREEFDRRFAEQLSRLSRHLTVYVSSTDQALLLSQWVNRGPRVGRTLKVQPEGDGEPQFAHAERLMRLQSEGVREITVVDVTPINRQRNYHNFQTDDREFLDELYVRLLNPERPISRRLYPIGANTHASFWILWDQ